MHDTLVPVTITPVALEEIRKIITFKNIPSDYALRVGVRGGGCGGLSYVLGFDTPKASDKCYVQDDLQIVVEKRHVMYLLGTEIDFEDGSNARGFTFQRPGSEVEPTE
ncbi:iron-sulfur cluster assembly protein [Catalinimonas alkaloidigena]|uniref:Iron-sulfur cluster assembly protein n=1 Tax=Catalinimonas alkaloidigena TaxID=1075417 RepID=A0A1G8XKJ6_9BACT|nr:iron-sulfur cluster assembly accessory protein [Catalinimonas alkaloidigena]SDJ91111.1 iron-sulfur cluster assembly protein [Catalinimonas alkaloidigena]